MAWIWFRSKRLFKPSSPAHVLGLAISQSTGYQAGLLLLSSNPPASNHSKRSAKEAIRLRVVYGYFSLVSFYGYLKGHLDTKKGLFIRATPL